MTVRPVEACVGGGWRIEDVRGVVRPVVVVRRLAVVGVGRTQAVVRLDRRLQGGVERGVSLVLILNIMRLIGPDTPRYCLLIALVDTHNTYIIYIYIYLNI